MTCYICAKKNCVDDCQIKMKLNYFTDDSPTNYCADDNMKHLYFKDYKHLKNVTWVDDSESPLTKVLTGLAFVVTLITLLFIATI